MTLESGDDVVLFCFFQFLGVWTSICFPDLFFLFFLTKHPKRSLFVRQNASTPAQNKKHRIQKSFRRDARTTLALQGKRQTLNEQGMYEIMDAVKAEEGAELVLPKLEPDKLDKLQDDLLNGIHVTYHDKGEEG